MSGTAVEKGRRAGFSPPEGRGGLKSTLRRLLAIALGMTIGIALLGAAMIAMFGSPAERPALAAASDDEPLQTFAGIAPVAWLVERIGGPCVRVEVLVPAGKDPHIFEPTPRQMIALSQARLFFRVGLPLEDRLLEHLCGAGVSPALAAGTAAPQNGIAGGPAQFTVVDTAAGITKLASSDEDEGQTDPHVWLSPPNLKTMAANVTAALCQADPRHEPVYQANLQTLDAELDALHHRIARSLAPYHGQAFYVFHPAFGYFADTYGLRQESVEIEGKLPTPRQVLGLITMARNDHVKIIFLQPQFNQQIAASIAQAIGGAVLPLDDLALDVVANLDDVAQKIAASNRERTP